MESANGRSIRGWIDENSSVSAVAAELNLSRPTIYKYIEKFDKGDRDKLPKDVVEYFEHKLTPKDDPVYVMKRASLTDKSMMIASKLELEKARLKELLLKKEALSYEIEVLEKKSMDDPEANKDIGRMTAELKVISNECMTCSGIIHETEDKLIEINAELSRLEDVKTAPSTSSPVFNIKSSCFIENGKCMVVHTGDKTITCTEPDGRERQEPVHYRLHLYAKVGSEYAHLGDYLPVKNRNFFVIDDVFLSAPLYYNIVACVEDTGFEDEEGELARPEGEPNLIELSGSESTGMCELKQKK